MTTSSDHPVVEAALESAEVVTDILTRSEVLAEVPFVGLAIKFCKAADSIRNRAFAAKLSGFLQNLEGISEEQKNKLKEKMSANLEEAQKVGATLLFVLERVTDLDKPLLLSQIFLAYIDNIISNDEFRRLAQAVDAAFADDLQRLLITHKTPERSTEPWMQYLVASGLTRLVVGQTYGDLGTLYYEITPLGNKLKNAYFHGRKDMAASS